MRTDPIIVGTAPRSCLNCAHFRTRLRTEGASGRCFLTDGTVARAGEATCALFYAYWRVPERPVEAAKHPPGALAPQLALL